MRIALAFPILLLLLSPVRGASMPENKSVVVVANSAFRSSEELAAYYMRVRGIESNRLCKLDLPTNETMSPAEFASRLRNPLLQFLRDRKLIRQVRRDDSAVGPLDSGWRTFQSDIRYVVLMRGVPLRIDDLPASVQRRAASALNVPLARVDAAVDSELALMLRAAYDREGPAANPAYSQYLWGELGPAAAEVMIVARLDAPDDATVVRMIDDSLYAETNGLLGEVYCDTRGFQGGSDQSGDYWIREAGLRFDREGFNVIFDMREQVMGPSSPVHHCVFYAGWYAENVTGPFAAPDFRFARGAFAYHLQSGSAKTLRSTTAHWAGPLLAHGACCTVGAVSEPALPMTLDLQIFADRLCSGHTFGESAYMALRALSWQMTVVGDPLYRPFGTRLDARLRRLEEAGSPDVEWLYLQSANLFVTDGRLFPAMDLLRSCLRQRDSAILRERLADLYAANNMPDDATAEYERALRLTDAAPHAFRIGARCIRIYALQHKTDAIGNIRAALLKRWPASPFAPLLEAAPP